ncbi:hypothetical protein LX32DRAFT_221442 [Colletotrichum zoysiae]|uniref:Uncharacterized protein n=1 Tax=Colletotrichum zoysiae TaxID=1216348 RepID=A0AAD9LUW0_9PEZI|nr:hypothetical protein LX32DRAFT_221442 [Colletotrichum zoysiae]
MATAHLFRVPFLAALSLTLSLAPSGRQMRPPCPIVWNGGQATYQTRQNAPSAQVTVSTPFQLELSKSDRSAVSARTSCLVCVCDTARHKDEVGPFLASEPTAGSGDNADAAALDNWGAEEEGGLYRTSLLGFFCMRFALLMPCHATATPQRGRRLACRRLTGMAIPESGSSE